MTKLMIGCNSKQLSKILTLLAIDFGMTVYTIKHNSDYPAYMRPVCEFNIEFLNYDGSDFGTVKTRLKRFKDVTPWTYTQL